MTCCSCSRVAELEAEVERLEQANADAGRIISGDPETMLDKLHIIGIPARDLVDIYKIVAEWRRHGGGESYLELWRRTHTPRSGLVIKGIGGRGLHDYLDVTNFGETPVRLEWIDRFGESFKVLDLKPRECAPIVGTRLNGVTIREAP